MKFLKVIIAVAAIACTASVAQAQVVKRPQPPLRRRLNRKFQRVSNRSTRCRSQAMPTCSG